VLYLYPFDRYASIGSERPSRSAKRKQRKKHVSPAHPIPFGCHDKA
jgi:hypothetical protein